MPGQLKKTVLGNTGLAVTEFCLGVLPMGPLQADLPRDKCVSIIESALAKGVNFFDTAEMYKTQPYLGEVLRSKRSGIVVATKSAAAGYDDMAASVERSLKEMRTDYIDIYHLHAARPGEEVFTGRKGALDCLVEMKRQQVVRAVGIATHNARSAGAAAERDDIDIIFAIINQRGMGVVGGTLEEMLQSIRKAGARGKGVYAMKALGGGNLIAEAAEAFGWVRSIKEIGAVAVGVVSEEELRMDLGFFGWREPSGEAVTVVPREKKLFILESICKGCASCVDACPNGALAVKEGKAKVDRSSCLLCGYCGPDCPEFAIRVI